MVKKISRVNFVKMDSLDRLLMIKDGKEKVWTCLCYCLRACCWQRQNSGRVFGEILEKNAYLAEIFDGEMLNITIITTLLQIFSKIIR